MKITVLSENTALREDLRAEYGLSMLVEKGRTRLLFDVGGGDAFLQNARVLGIDLNGLTAVAFSHNHRDHCGGLTALEGLLPGDCPIYAHAGFFTDKWWDHHFDGPDTDTQAPTVEHVGPPVGPEYFHRMGYTGFRVLTDDTFALGDGIFLLGNFPVPHGAERVAPSQLMTGPGGRLRRDTFREEQVCVIRTARGLTVLTGCAHNGIRNILRTVQKRFPGEKILAVFGGTHLVPYSEQRTEKTIRYLNRLSANCLGVCHCTGPALPSMEKEALAYRRTGAGLIYETDD